MFSTSKEISHYIIRVLYRGYWDPSVSQTDDKCCFAVNTDKDTVRRICERAFCEMEAEKHRCLPDHNPAGKGMVPLYLSEQEANDQRFVNSLPAGTKYEVIHVSPEFQFEESGESREYRYAVREDLIPYVERILIRNFHHCTVKGNTVCTDVEYFEDVAVRAYCESVSKDDLSCVYLGNEEAEDRFFVLSLFWRFPSRGYMPIEVDTKQLFSRIA